MAKKDVRPTVEKIQNIRRSGAAGSHKQPSDRTRAEKIREAINEDYDECPYDECLVHGLWSDCDCDA